MKFDMSAAWRDATTMISANREVLLIVAGIFFFLPSVILGFAVGDLQEMMLADPENVQQAMLSIYTEWGWLFALVMVASMVGYLALLALLRDSSRPTVGEAMKTGLVGLLPAIGTYLVLTVGLSVAVGVVLAAAAVSGVAALAALALLVAMAFVVYVFVKVSLSGPVIALEKVFNPFGVLARSWRLTSGNSFRLFLFYLLLIVAYVVISVVVAMVTGALVLAIGQSAAVTVSAILNGLISSAATVVFVAVLAAVHRQLAGPSAEAVGATFE
ncbi:MAG TPA: hypothetical protein VEB68_11305 [Croceibacterium sp.]|nr:hypothetical protein [Croceibacterium sp.]